MRNAVWKYRLIARTRLPLIVALSGFLVRAETTMMTFVIPGNDGYGLSESTPASPAAASSLTPGARRMASSAREYFRRQGGSALFWIFGG